MSTSDLQLKLVRDSVLNDIKSSIPYAVKRGAASLTYQQVNANSSSSSSCSFQITPPSESTGVHRAMHISSKINFQIQIGEAPGGAGLEANVNVWQYGLRESLASFPLNKLFLNSQLSINNTSVSVNNGDILDGLLRMLSAEMMQEYYGTTPCYLDNYALYSDANGASNNPMRGYDAASYNDKLLPRGCYEFEFIKPDGVGVDVGINRFNGSTRIDASPFSTGPTDWWIIGLSVKVREPLMVSPCLFGDPKFNEAAFLGVNAFSLTLSVDSQMKRFWSSGLDKASKYSLSFNAAKPFEDMKMELAYYTAPMPLILPSKSVLPLSSYVSYVTSQTQSHALNTEVLYNINSLQLNQVPDKVIVYIRNKKSDMSARVADSFLEIRSVNITFANTAGILSGATQYDLWKLSKKNGLQQDFLTWRGHAAGYDGEATGRKIYPTTGSVLCFDPAFDWSVCSAPFLSAGSIGQYNLSMKINAYRNCPDHPGVTGFTPEIVVIIVN